MTTERAAFSRRLRRLLAEKRLEASAQDLVQLLARHGRVSVSPQAVSGWLNGKFMPKPVNMRALAAVLGVDLQTLQTDVPPRHMVKESAAAWPVGLSGKDRLALREYAALPATQRRLVRELITTLADGARRKGA